MKRPTTIQQVVKARVKAILQLETPRRSILRWMRNNPIWMRELIAREWGRQSKRDWESLFEASVK